MTQDEIIEMARQVCDIDTDKRGRNTFLCDEYGLEAFTKLVAEKERERVEDLCMRGTQLAVLVAKAEEREACAKICDSFQERDVGMQPAECAGAIRARGQA